MLQDNVKDSKTDCTQRDMFRLSHQLMCTHFGTSSQSLVAGLDSY